MKGFNFKSLFSSNKNDEKDTNLNALDIKSENTASGTMIKMLPVEGMSCSSCAKHVQTALKSQNGVASADVNLSKSDVKVVFNPQIVSLEELKAAVDNAGYNLIIE